jgi:hypothetical protein
MLNWKKVKGNGLDYYTVKRLHFPGVNSKNENRQLEHRTPEVHLFILRSSCHITGNLSVQMHAACLRMCKLSNV